MVEQGTVQPDGRVQAFLAMLRQQPSEADCRLCLSQLHNYVVARQTGADDATQFSWIAQHLDSCVTCAEAYGLLYELVLAEAQGELAQPERLPTPDLSFLTAVPDLATSLSQAIQQTGQRVILQLNDVLAALLAPLPQTALTRSTNEGRYGQKVLELTPEQVPDVAFPLTLIAYADQEQPGRCLVEVTVEPPGLSWPDLGGRTITLTIEELSLTASTDEWGAAVFLDILILDLDSLRLDISLAATG